MSTGLHLLISTPIAVLVDAPGVVAVRAEDESGSFGIRPGHADLITALSPSVVRWREADGTRRFCAVLGGVLTVDGGCRVGIACRRGVVGADLAALEADARARRAAEADVDRHARVEQLRLHAQAVRQLMRYLRPGAHGDGPPPGRGFQRERRGE
jgi:F-type H+-transporting ATPase subunit epsilon